jgi:signal peptidase I
VQRVHRFRFSHPPAPRSFAAALVLTVLMPGLGHVYCGALTRGLRAWALAFGTLLVAFLCWLRWLFVPWFPVAVLLLAWAFFVGVLAADLWRMIHGEGHGGRRFVLTPSNHFVVYLSLFLGLWGGPLLLGQHVVRRIRVGLVSVDDRGMFPKLLEGDRVLFDRAAYRHVAPVAGDLVVLRWGAGEPRIARVIATGGHTVSLQGGRPFVDGAAVPWAPIEDLRVPALGDGPDAMELAGLRAFAEEPTAPAYVVTYGVMPPRDPPPVVLAPGEYFVMGDNRSTALADGGFGRVSADAILGRPRFVFASQSPDGDLRDGRIGWPVR